jgi:capsular polysaccharide biosynthesis protein
MITPVNSIACLTRQVGHSSHAIALRSSKVRRHTLRFWGNGSGAIDLELTEILRTLRARWLATTLVVVLAVGAAAAIKLTSHNVPTGAATVQILVDSPSSELANLTQNPTPLISRAAVFAQVMTSQAVVADIAAAAGVPPTQMTAQGPYSGAAESLDVITPAEARSNQLVAEAAPYRLTFLAQQNEPVITATVQAPNAAAAARAANAIYAGVQNYVKAIQHEGRTPDEDKVTLRELGSAQTATVNGKSRLTLIAGAFLAILIIGLLLILGIESLRRRDRELEELERGMVAEFEPPAQDLGARRPLLSTGERRR